MVFMAMVVMLVTGRGCRVVLPSTIASGHQSGHSDEIIFILFNLLDTALVVVFAFADQLHPGPCKESKKHSPAAWPCLNP